MSLKDIIQSKLDSVLLSYGVLSYHLKRVESVKTSDPDIEINNDEYVVYRIVSGRNASHGDGVAKLYKCYIDVNYYYAYDKNDIRFSEAEKRIDEVKKVILADNRFFLANGKSDIYEIDSEYRGINVEFLFVGVNGNECNNDVAF